MVYAWPASRPSVRFGERRRLSVKFQLDEVTYVHSTIFGGKKNQVMVWALAPPQWSVPIKTSSRLPQHHHKNTYLHMGGLFLLKAMKLVYAQALISETGKFVNNIFDLIRDIVKKRSMTRGFHLATARGAIFPRNQQPITQEECCVGE